MSLKLIADIGGSNARFAITESTEQAATRPELRQVLTLKCAEHQDFEAAIEHYLNLLGCKKDLDGACFALAAPLHEDEVCFTNNTWQFSLTALRQHLGLRQFRVINDFEAVAFAAPQLNSEELIPLGSGKRIEFQNTEGAQYALVGPGTGLGIAGIKVVQGNYINIVTEGGHSTFAPTDELETELLQRLCKQFSRVSNERLLSGSGILGIYHGLAEIYGYEPMSTSSPNIICQGAVDGHDKLCVQTMNLFFGILGAVAGDVALMFGATEGILLGGGILPRYVDLFVESDFRRRFEDKGRYRNYMENIPTEIIIYDNPGLLGAAVCPFQRGAS